MTQATVDTMTFEQAYDALEQYLTQEAQAQLLGTEKDFATDFVAALLGQMTKRSRENLGYDAASDTYQTAGLASAIVQKAIGQLAEIQTIGQLAGVSPPPLGTGFDAASGALFEALLTGVQALPRDQWQARAGLLSSLGTLNGLREVSGSAPIASAETATEWVATIEASLVGGVGRLGGDEVEMLRGAQAALGNAGVLASYQSRLTEALAAIGTLADSSWGFDELAEALPAFE